VFLLAYGFGCLIEIRDMDSDQEIHDQNRFCLAEEIEKNDKLLGGDSQEQAHLSIMDVDCKNGDVSRVLITIRENGMNFNLNMNTKQVTVLEGKDSASYGTNAQPVAATAGIFVV